MPKTTENTVETPVVKIDIIRGRMPAPIVCLIKFHGSDATPSALAAKYRTTVGKVNDILKDANFQYITESFIPTADMVTAALAYAEQLGDVKNEVISAINEMGVATAEDIAAFEIEKAKHRKPRAPKAAAVETDDAEGDADLEEDLEGEEDLEDAL